MPDNFAVRDNDGLKKKILFATLHPPGPSFSGGSATVYLLIRMFIEAGYDVAFLYLDPTRNSPETHAQARQKMLEIGVSDVAYVEHERDLFTPRKLSGLSGVVKKVSDRLKYSEKYYRPWKQMAPAVFDEVNKISPDFIFLYMLDVCDAFVTVKNIPKVLGIGVFPHKLTKVRLKQLRYTSYVNWLFSNFEWIFQRPKYIKAAKAALRSMDRICAFSDNERKTCEVLEPSVKVQYFPNPIPDERPDTDRQNPPVFTPNKPFRVSLVGHLRGSATLNGLGYFADHVVPALQKKGQFDNFQFEIIGKFTPPKWLLERLDYPNVRFIGFVEDFPTAVKSADAYLVPIPDDAGNRSRIVSAWSIGCCVVCHGNGHLAMPELEDDLNCLLGSSGPEIANALVAVSTDAALNRRLRENGRQAYDSIFRPDVSFPPVVTFVAGCRTSST